MTDQLPAYNGLENEFAGHEVVDHTAGQYVNGNAYTNTVEGWFSLLNRGVTGTFHHVSDQHLDRYVDEFVFRYNRRDVQMQNADSWRSKELKASICITKNR